MDSYKADLLGRLRDPEYAGEFIQAVLTDHMTEPFAPAVLLALRNVAEAWGLLPEASPDISTAAKLGTWLVDIQTKKASE